MQEVFAQVWAQAGRYDTARGAVAAWMLTMTRSRAIDRLRSRARGPRRPRKRASWSMPDTRSRQDLQLLSAEQVENLQRALNELPVAQRVALELAYYEGLTHAEIADRLSEPLGTVKTRIRQAVIKLRESLAAVRSDDGRRPQTTSVRNWSRRSCRDSVRPCRRSILRPSCVRGC